MGKITPNRSIPIVSSAKNGLQCEEPVPSDKFCLTSASKFAGNADLNSRVHVPSRFPFFRPLAFVFQASQSVPRFVSLVFRRLKICLRYEPSFIRRVIRQLVYNIFRCNDDLTSTDLSLSLSFPFSLHAYRPLFYNRFSVSRNTDKCRFERGNESRKLFIYEMYKYMFSIDLWFCFRREIFYSLFLSLSQKKSDRAWMERILRWPTAINVKKYRLFCEYSMIFSYWCVRRYAKDS